MLGFNVIISTQEYLQENARAEFWFLMKTLFHKESLTERYKYPGLVLGKIDGDPRVTLRQLGQVCEEVGFTTQYIQKLTPILRFVETDLDVLRAIVHDLVQEEFSPGDRFRVTLKRRGVKVPRPEWIDGIAHQVPATYEVDLEHPTRIVWVEVFAKYTGIAILQEADIFQQKN